MRLLFQKLRWSACNRIKYCMKYYSQYVALFGVALLAFMAYSIFRAYDGRLRELTFTISLWDILYLVKYPFLIVGMLVSYEVVILIMKFYQRAEGALRYSPVSKRDILFTEVLTVTMSAFCVILVFFLSIFLPMGMKAAFWGQVFLMLAVLLYTQVLLPVFFYLYLVVKAGKRLLFRPYLLAIQVVMTAQHALYVTKWYTYVYYGLLMIELALLLFTVAKLVKRPEQIHFYEIKSTDRREKKQQIKKIRMSQGRLILTEMQRHMGMLLQFILIPAALLIFSRIWSILELEMYISYYMAFIPSFFMGLFVSYREIYRRIPLNIIRAFVARLAIGILLMLAVEIPLYLLVGMKLSFQTVVNSVLFAAVMYSFIYVSGIKLVVDGRENPAYYLILIVFQYAYSTLLLYVQEFSFMGFGVALQEYVVSLLFLLAMGIVLIVQRGRRLS